jgi:hypothetical protein
MKLEDILPLFREGQRIRRESWKKGWYSQIVAPNQDDGESTRVCLFLDDILADDWEIEG